MSERENVRIVQEAYAAFMRGEIEAVESALAEDIDFLVLGPTDIIPFVGQRYGREQVKQFFGTWVEVEELQRFEPQEVIAQGDKVIVFVNWRSLVRATGRTIELDLVHVWTLRDGKLAKFREYYDTYTAVEAYRVAPTEGAKVGA